MRAGTEEGEVCPKGLLSLGIEAPQPPVTPWSSSAAAATPAPDYSRLPGARVSHYVIRDTLGRGGMGIVYRAADTRLDRTVAIKVLPEHVASDADLKQRFEREARTVAALNHPHIW